jgi:hypothetical protein
MEAARQTRYRHRRWGVSEPFRAPAHPIQDEMTENFEA